MKKLKIITGAENPILRAKSVPVKHFDEGLKKFVLQMKKSMESAKGLGIAAPQVGKNIRVFWVVLNYDKKDQVAVAMVNPKIVSRSRDTEIGEEGCLSLPGVYGKVERFREITVEYFDLDEVRHSLTLEGLDARVVLHENDHIDGILFIDRIKAMDEKKDLAL
ncbi:MAG: peptide deformylase [bacterium]|nr:peptide deformylase [bacterium]